MLKTVLCYLFHNRHSHLVSYQGWGGGKYYCRKCSRFFYGSA